jgi:hypothetical protein
MTVIVDVIIVLVCWCWCVDVLVRWLGVGDAVDVLMLMLVC